MSHLKLKLKNFNPYWLEYLFLASVAFLSVTGFWNIYVGVNATPNFLHHLHVITNVIWLLLLLCQLSLIGSKKYELHKKIGLSVLFFAPLLFATTALLSVQSAHKGLISGRGDFLIVQNVMVTLELGLTIVLAFAFRKRRKLHGAFLLSTAMLFMGIALFFTLISFVPAFKIAGPETFYRFKMAAITGQAICVCVGLVFLIKDFRNGWPYLLAAGYFVLNELIRALLTAYSLIDPMTEWIGSMTPSFAFIGSFLALLGLLTATGIHKSRRLVTRQTS